ncbi:hypothetical protein RRG08_021263 [Elysia crispata]|uniref:Uncharacterized protein n=1 Tax=Elysia crispata TaxID=231223 RepID=A0AAE0YV59_9GAST|nr:hypothetical protein RRG08_021263 [Elysia crispata]
MKGVRRYPTAGSNLRPDGGDTGSVYCAVEASTHSFSPLPNDVMFKLMKGAILPINPSSVGMVFKSF